MRNIFERKPTEVIPPSLPPQPLQSVPEINIAEQTAKEQMLQADNEILPNKIRINLDFEITTMNQLKNVLQFENDMLFDFGVIIASEKRRI